MACSGRAQQGDYAGIILQGILSYSMIFGCSSSMPNFTTVQLLAVVYRAREACVINIRASSLSPDSKSKKVGQGCLLFQEHQFQQLEHAYAGTKYLIHPLPNIWS